MWSSPDGRQWEPVEGLPDIAYIADAGQLGGGVVMVAESFDSGGLVLTAATVSGPWEVTPLSESVPISSGEGRMGASIRPTGMVVGGGGNAHPPTEPAASLVAYSSDGNTWSVFPLTNILGPVSVYPQEVVATENGAVALLLMQPPVGPSRPVLAIGTTSDDGSPP